MRANSAYQDEDTLRPPGSWDPPLAVRGETVAKAVNSRAVRTVADILEAKAVFAAETLAQDDTAPEVAAAAPGSPLRAATLAYLAPLYTWGRDARVGATLCRNLGDAWVAEHGVAFALRAVTDLARMSSRHVSGRHGRLRLGEELDGHWTAAAALVRLREILAGMPEEEYAAMLGTLTEIRSRLPGPTRVLTSFLAPTQREWVEQDAAAWEPSQSRQALLLMGCVQGRELLDRLLWVNSSLEYVPGLMSTSLSAMGERAVGFVAHKDRLKWLWALPYDSAYRALRDMMGDRDALPWLALASERFPARAVRLLAEDDEHKPAGELLRQHVLAHPQVAAAVLPTLTGARREKVAVVLAELDDIAPGEVPPILAQPPWTMPTAGKPVVIKGLRCDEPPTIHWLPGERPAQFEWDWTSQLDRVSARDHDLDFLYGPVDSVRPRIRALRFDNDYLAREILPQLIARFELDAFPAAFDYAGREPIRAAKLLLPYASPDLAMTVAAWYGRYKKLRDTCRDWLNRHPAAAALALTPNALGRAGAARRQAEEALRVLVSLGHEAAVHEAADGYGPAAAAAIGTLLDADPGTVPPPRIPEIWSPMRGGALPPLLRGRTGRLPAAAVPDLLTMFALSTPEIPYRGVATVKDALDPADLARFAWDTFRRWYRTGADPKQEWVLTMLGLVGDDDTARRFARFILPGPADVGDAPGRLDVLTAIGTDAALIQMHHLSQRSPARPIRSTAERKLQEVAARRGLTSDQLPTG